jgi:predicted Zn-dependent protease
MTTKERILDVLEKGLRFSGADQTEVLVMAEDIYLTRYATNYIHQNTAESNAEFYVRAVLGRKIGMAVTNAIDDESLRRAVRTAEDIARVQPDLADFLSLPDKTEVGDGPPACAFAAATAAFTAEERAAAVGRVTALAAENGYEAAGAFGTATARVGVANSLGVRRFGELTRANFSVIVMGDTGSGFAEGIALDVGKIDVGGMAATAVGKCREARNPKAVEPGDYEVILEPPAVADMIRSLAFLGMGARSLQEGRSFMCGRIGQKVTGENLTVWDDGQDPAGLPLPFDFEGVLRQKVVLIENGVAKGVVYDSYGAGREPGRKSTGHALPPRFRFGAVPLNLFVKTGDSSVPEMIKATKRGILVTRFHYTNPLHPVLTTLTGMTRDGTFLIEDGKVKGPVKNMRFTNSILEALSGIEAIGAQTFTCPVFGLGSVTTPALKLRKFSFTGATEH